MIIKYVTLFGIVFFIIQLFFINIYCYYSCCCFLFYIVGYLVCFIVVFIWLKKKVHWLRFEQKKINCVNWKIKRKNCSVSSSYSTFFVFFTSSPFTKHKINNNISIPPCLLFVCCWLICILSYCCCYLLLVYFFHDTL